MGTKTVYCIRVLKCVNKACPSKYHRELPDIIVPYKRYNAESIEEAIDHGNSDTTVAADEATIKRWRKWFSLNGTYVIMALLSVMATMGDDVIPSSLANEKTHVHKLVEIIKGIVGRKIAWLCESVRILVNSAKWIFNRSAFMTG
jgi:hypothetical protein